MNYKMLKCLKGGIIYIEVFKEKELYMQINAEPVKEATYTDHNVFDGRNILLSNNRSFTEWK